MEVLVLDGNYEFIQSLSPHTWRGEAGLGSCLYCRCHGKGQPVLVLCLEGEVNARFVEALGVCI